MTAVSDRLSSLWRKFTDREYRQFRRTVKAYKRTQARGVVTDFPDLGPQSVAFDFGGYQGEWAAAMHRKYGCTVHVFEAHPAFARDLDRRFADNPSIHIHAFALASGDGPLALSDDDDASSARLAEGEGIAGRRVSVDRFFAQHVIKRIDVAKMNIEGGEYDLLPALLSRPDAPLLGTLLVQFHKYERGDAAARDAIHQTLERTHDCDWCYEFVWEQWSRRPA